MRTQATIGLTLSLMILVTSGAFAQGRGGGCQRGMRGCAAGDCQGQMDQRCPMRNGQGTVDQNRQGQRGGFGRGGGAGQASFITGQLTRQETESILLLRQEEKLARDVYWTLGEIWNVPVFQNIPRSEARHMAAMKVLVDRYDLEDPVTDDTVGTFASPEFSQMYRELVASGSISLADAYEVGVSIEELDIKDLQEALTHTKKPDIRRVYQNLLRASENHLRAFSSDY